MSQVRPGSEVAASGPAVRTPHAPASAGVRLVNAEAVEIDVRVARVGSRALALAFDILVQAVLVGLLVLLAVIAASSGLIPQHWLDDALFQTTVVVIMIAVLIVYPTTVETLTNGRSVGKAAVGLRVVREDGGPIRLRHAFTRTLIGVAVEWPGLIMPPLTWLVALVTMIFSPQGRRLGDLAAGTLMIHERAPATWGAVPSMPWALAGWAGVLDLTAMDDDLALAIRLYLARASELVEPQRSRLAQQLAAELYDKVSPPPPPGTPAGVFLAAVLAERRQRSIGRVLAGRALAQRMWPGFGDAGLPWR